MVSNSIETSDLTKRYRGRFSLDRLNLVVPSNCILGLAGLNGAGKSTAVKLLLGLLRPDEGEARVLGLSPFRDHNEIHRLVGYVPEIPHFFPWMTVSETIGFVKAFYLNWDDTVCNNLLKRFELDRSKRTSDLSKGMRMKLSLLLALSHRPELLLLDEATDGLDPFVRKDVLGTIVERVKQHGTTVVFATHLLEDIDHISDRLAIIKDGKLALHRSFQDVRTRLTRVEVATSSAEVMIPLPACVLSQVKRGLTSILLVDNLTVEETQAISRTQGVATVEARKPTVSEVFEAMICGSGLVL